MRIKMGVRGLILGFMGVALITLIQVGPVYAINTAYLDLNLTNWNVDDIQSTGDYIHVTATNVGSNTVLTFTFVYGSQPPTIQSSPMKGINEVGWNSTAAVTPVAGWSLDNNCGLDGFGCFHPDLKYSGSNGNTGVGPGPVSFTLAGNNLNFGNSTTINGKGGGHQFAVHVQFGSNCSGFVSDGTHVDKGYLGGDCIPSVPEPASLLLLGTGLLTLMGLGIWRKNRARN